MSRCIPIPPAHPEPPAVLFGGAHDDASSDRIPLEEGCALLGVRPDTFRDQYLSPERWATFAPRFGLEKDERKRVTVSRRLILEQLDAVRRDPWGGAYGPSGMWGRRVRQAWEELTTYDAAAQAAAGSDDAPRDEPSASDPQGDLFAP